MRDRKAPGDRSAPVVRDQNEGLLRVVRRERSDVFDKKPGAVRGDLGRPVGQVVAALIGRESARPIYAVTGATISSRALTE